jgi:hypothetical protein
MGQDKMTELSSIFIINLHLSYEGTASEADPLYLLSLVNIDNFDLLFIPINSDYYPAFSPQLLET